MYSCESEKTLPSATTEKLSGIKASQQVSERQCTISEPKRQHTFHLHSKSSRPFTTRQSEHKIYSPRLTYCVLQMTRAVNLSVKELSLAKYIPFSCIAFACDHFYNTPH